MRHQLCGGPLWRMIGAALLLVLLVAVGGLGAQTAGSPPSFVWVAEPSWVPEPPRDPGAIVPDSSFEGAASWSCLGRRALVERHGDDESERLVRLSVVLEASRATRARVLVLRAAAHRAGERLLEAVAARVEDQLEGTGRGDRPAWLAAAIDPFALALEDTERAAWERWAVLAPPAGQCSQGSDLVTDRALGLALLILQRDEAFAVVRADLDVLVREGCGLVSAAGRGGGRSLEGLVAAVDTALEALVAAERDWREPRTLLAELVESTAAERGLAAAGWASSLHAAHRAVAASGSPVAAEAASLLASATRHAGEYAATAYPGFVVVHPTMLDLEHAPEDSPRRAPVARLIASLGEQLPILERLYDVRIEREAAWSVIAGETARAEIDALRRRSEWLWYQLAEASRMLRGRGLDEERSSWAWTRVGTLRDQLVLLEQTLAHLEEEELLWGAESNPQALADIVERQHRLVTAIEAARLAEAAPLAELLRQAEGLLAPSAAASSGLARVAAESRSAAAAADARAFLGVVEDVLAQRSASIQEAVELLAQLRAGSSRGEGGAAATATDLSFSQAATVLRPLPDLERLLAVSANTREAMQSLGMTGSGPARQVANLRLATLVDVPVEVRAAPGSLTLRLRAATAEFAMTLPLEGGLVARSWLGHDADPFVSDRGFVRAAHVTDLWTTRRVAPAVLRWSGRSGMSTLRPGVVPASSGGVPPEHWTQESRTPPGWEDQIRHARENPQQNIASNVADAVASNWIGYTASVLVLGVGAVASAPAVLVVGGGMLFANAAKDAVTGGANAVNAAYGSVDPRDRADMSRRIGVVRTWVDAMGIVTGSVDASAPIELADPLSDAIGIGVSVAGGDPDAPTDPYLVRVAQADALIDAAYQAALACNWPEARRLVDQAYQTDPYKQSRNWVRIGNRVAQLAHEWEQFGHNAEASLASARQRAQDEVYGCGPEAETLPVHLAQSYVDEARWACDTTFVPLMEQLTALGVELARMRGVLSAAEGSCDPDEVRSLAQEVITWATGAGRSFACAPLMQSAAEDVLAWAANGQEDPAAVLAQARREVEACRLVEAKKLLSDTPPPPSRCLDPGLAAMLEETRSQILGLIAERERADARLETLEPEAEQAIAECDGVRAEELLAELSGLQLCAQGSGSQREALAARLRRTIELISGHDATLLEQAKGELNEATRATDGGCDMVRARRHLEQAREILFQLSTSQCGTAFLDEFDQVVAHGTYVEGRITEREALLARIRAAFNAGDAALNTALRTCSEADLDRAVQLLGEVLRGIDSIPVMADPACEEFVRLAGRASEAQQEAATLKTNWAGIDADLASARQAAAEGRAIDVDVYCAGVRRRAQPASCFADALQECEGLGASQPTTGTPAPPVPPSPPPVVPPVTTGWTGTPSGSSSGGGSGRVQIADPEPCARDMSWVPARQRFECTCPGYRLDEDLGRCVPGAAPAAVTQAVCDAQWPGTVLEVNRVTGEAKCDCPGTSAWSTVHNACLDLGVGADESAAAGCAHMPGTVPDPVTGECRCPVGTWVRDRCVDTAAEERGRRVADREKAAECERLFSDIQVFRGNPDALSQQMAANAEAQARRKGCDSVRIADAIERGNRRGWTTPGGGGGQPRTGGTGGEAGGDQGEQGGGESQGQQRGTCHIIEYPNRGEVTLVFEQQAQGNHINVSVISGDEEDVGDVQSYFASLPGHRYVGSYRSYGAAMEAARSLCRGRDMY